MEQYLDERQKKSEPRILNLAKISFKNKGKMNIIFR